LVGFFVFEFDFMLLGPGCDGCLWLDWAWSPLNAWNAARVSSVSGLSKKYLVIWKYSDFDIANAVLLSGFFVLLCVSGTILRGLILDEKHLKCKLKGEIQRATQEGVLLNNEAPDKTNIFRCLFVHTRLDTPLLPLAWSARSGSSTLYSPIDQGAS
jgi:hypothetical protein